MKQFGAYLKRLRDDAGLSQEEAAQRFGMSVKTLSNWENGKRVPDFAKAARYIEMLGGSLEEAASWALGNGRGNGPTAEENRRRLAMDALGLTEEMVTSLFATLDRLRGR